MEYTGSLKGKQRKGRKLEEICKRLVRSHSIAKRKKRRRKMTRKKEEIRTRLMLCHRL